ncbi:hypothetical protein Tco_0104125 [Tanacetum coccineum]
MINMDRTLPSENTSVIPVEPESLGPPPELIPVRRSERTTRAPNRLCLNMEVEDDVVGDLGEPANYKAAMLDPDKVIWQDLDYGFESSITSMELNEFDEEIKKLDLLKIVISHGIFAKLMDVMIAKANVRFAQNLISRNQQNPWKPPLWLLFKSKSEVIWGIRENDTKSQTGYVFVVNGGAVDWKSKKHTTILMTATQAAYMLLQNLLWREAVVLGIIKQGAKTFSNGIYHYVREQVKSGEIKIFKVHIDDNLADPFTKALPRGNVTDLANGIGLQLASSFMHTVN